MKNLKYIIPLMVIGGITVGTSYAVITHSEQTNIFGQLNVIDANFVVNRADGFDSGLVVRNNGGGASTFQFFDQDDNQAYRFTLKNDGTAFEFFDVTHARKDLIVETATGNIGIGTTAPTERLDVNGDLRVRGNIVSTGDICIGTCP